MALPTFRLYVGHTRPLERHEQQQLRRLLSSRAVKVFTRPTWTHTFASFSSTWEAIAAKEALETVRPLVICAWSWGTHG